MKVHEIYRVGDLVKSTRRNCDGAVKEGDFGVVAKVERGQVLIDWQVTPDGDKMHKGNRVGFSLPSPTGWWIFDSSSSGIELVDDVALISTAADINLLFT